MQKSKSDRLKRGNRDDKLVKPMSRNNTMSHILEGKHDASTEQRPSVSIVPTPIDFDNFVPWVCREWSVAFNVRVVRPNQEVNVDLEIKKLLSKHLGDSKEESIQKSIHKVRVSETLDFHLSCVPDEKQEKVVVIEAHYDAQNHLEEISFIECSNGIPKKVIRAINLCLPFHSNLTRINIRKGRLTKTALNAIAEMLPHSNITIICLDDSLIPLGCYHILIEDASQLTYLSLNRCRIDDDGCKEIAMNLTFGKGASNSINVLELASNVITDIGAEYLGKMLRTNRRLLHLNLADNKITDSGGKALISALMEFSLTCDEVLEMKRKRLKSLKKIPSLFKKSAEHIKMIYEASETSKLSVHTSLHRASSKFNHPRARTSISHESPRYTVSLDGECLDPYTTNNLELRNGYYFAKGNFILCSLNLAYNGLNHPFIKKVEEVLAYQHHALKILPDTGLIRIVLDGNYMPTVCQELNKIEAYLKFNIDRKQPKPIVKKRHSSTTSKRSLIKAHLKVK